MPVNYIHVRILSDDGDKPQLRELMRKIHDVASEHLGMNDTAGRNTGIPDSILTTNRCYVESPPMRIEVEKRFPDS